MTKKIALVTGANGGLGRAIAARLAAEHGAKVFAGARRLEAAESVAAGLRAAGGDAAALALDVTDAGSVARAAAAVRDAEGRLDMILNVAGVNPPGETSLLDVKPEAALAAVDANALGPLRVAQAFGGLMGAGGRIVNVSTEMASMASMGSDFYPLSPSYRLSKAALNALTVLMAREFGPKGVLVNAYSPGWLRTEMGGPNAPFSAEEGAETALWLATLPEGGPNGGFFAEMRRIGGPVRLNW